MALRVNPILRSFISLPLWDLVICLECLWYLWRSVFFTLMILRSLLTGFSFNRLSCCFTVSLENHGITERIEQIRLGLLNVISLVQQTNRGFIICLIVLGRSENLSLSRFNVALDLVLTDCGICFIAFRTSEDHSSTQSNGLLRIFVNLGLIKSKADLLTRLCVQ